MPNEVDYTQTAPGHLLRQKVERLGYYVLMMDRWMDMDRAQGVRITEMRVKLRRGDQQDVLIVIKAEKEGRAFVGFHSSQDASEAIKGAVARVENGTMVWKYDEWAAAPEGSAD